MDKARLARLQEKLAQKVQIPPGNSGYRPQPDDVVFGLDVQYVKDKAYVALDVQKWEGENVGTWVGLAHVKVPYVPQFFCFREGPPLLKMIRAAHRCLGLQPDLLVVDGHGVAHPRRFGVACWLGVRTDVPTIGCAKETLVRYREEIEKKRGNYVLIEDKDEIVGAVLVTRDNTKPVFVSPGHRISLKIAIDVILKLSPRYRIAEPLRRADHRARACAKEITGADARSLFCRGGVEERERLLKDFFIL